MASPIPVPPVSRRVVKKASKIFSRFGFGYRIAIIADRHLDGASFLDRFQPHGLRVVTDGVVGQMRQHDQRFLAGHADWALEASGCLDRSGREPALQSADDLRQFGVLVLRRGLGARQFAQPLGHGLQAPGVAQNVRYEILLLHPGKIVGLALQRIQQQFGGALDRRQRRLQFMGEVRRKGRDVVRPPRQLLGHVEEAVRQLGELARAVMGERLKCVAIAAADARGAIDQLAHRAGDGSGENQADDDGRENDGKCRQDELAALLIEMVEDVARRSRCIDDARDAVVDDDRHRREHVDADAAADRVDRRRRLVGLANPQDRPVLSPQRCGYFLDMGERLADLVAAGDHDAAGIEDAETGQRDLLRFQDDRHQPRADLDIAGDAGALAGRALGRRRSRSAPAARSSAGRIGVSWSSAIRAGLGRNFSAERNPGAEAGFHFPRIDRGEHPALSDQFGLGLVNELVVIEAEEEQPDQRQCRRGGERGKNDLPHRRSPFFTRAGHHACGSHRPSLKPTP